MPSTTSAKTPVRGGSFLLDAPDAEDIFTPADLSEEQKLVGRTGEKFVKQEVMPRVKELEEKKPGLMVELLKKAGEVGLLGGGVPEEYGGAALDKIAATLLTEKISLYAGFAVTHGAQAGLATLPIVYFGTEEQKRKYLPKLASGEWIGAYCLSEPQAGSDALNVLTRAELSADGRFWLLNGQKMWTTNGGFADVFIVFAKVGGERFSAFIVERAFPGLTVGAEERKMGIHGSSTTPVFFENCRVPQENLLYEAGQGHVVAFDILNAGRLSLGASCLGGAKYVLGLCCKYAQERRAFGKPIGEFGLIREKLAEMTVRIFAVESMIYRTAGAMHAAMSGAPAPGQAARHGAQQAMEVHEEYAIECSLAKVSGSEMLDFCVDQAVQIFGGYGYHEDYPVARIYRDSRINRIFEGTNEVNRLLTVHMLMKRASAGTLPLLQAASKLADEILAGPALEEPLQGVLAEEARAVSTAKKAFLLAAGGALRKYRDNLAEAQEVVAALADMVMEIYAAESCLLRAQKAAKNGGTDAGGATVDAARVFICGALERLEHHGRRVLTAALEGDMLAAQLAVLRRFCKSAPTNGIALRQRVAAAVQSAGKYPLERN
jgi:alkylation response protein AidB-like acyl-CoA dehydrogenase